MTISNAPTKLLYEKETPVKGFSDFCSFNGSVKRKKEKETLLGIYLEIINLKVAGDCNKN